MNGDGCENSDWAAQQIGCDLQSIGWTGHDLEYGEIGGTNAEAGHKGQESVATIDVARLQAKE